MADGNVDGAEDARLTGTGNGACGTLIGDVPEFGELYIGGAGGYG